MKKLAAVILVLWSMLVCTAFAPLYVPAINIVSGAAPASNLVSPLLAIANYDYFWASGSGYGVSNDASRYMVMAADGVISDFYYNDANSGYSLDIYKNGSYVATICTTVANVCSNTSLTVSVSAGDLVGYKLSYSFLGYPDVRVGAKFTASNGQYQTLTAFTPVGTPYQTASYSTLDGYSTRNNQSTNGSLIPTNGVIDAIYVVLASTPGATATITLMKNAVDTSLSCVIVGTTCTATSTVSVVAGDILSVKTSSNVVGILGVTGLRWSPSTPDEALLLSGNTTGPSNTITEYTPFGSKYYNIPAPTPVPYNSTVKTLSVANKVAPSSGKSFTTTIRKGPYGSVSDTSLSCQVVDANTTCSDNVNSVNVTAGQSIDIKSVPNNTPNSGGVAVSAVIVTSP